MNIPESNYAFDEIARQAARLLLASPRLRFEGDPPLIALAGCTHKQTAIFGVPYTDRGVDGRLLAAAVDQLIGNLPLTFRAFVQLPIPAEIPGRSSTRLDNVAKGVSLVVCQDSPYTLSLHVGTVSAVAHAFS